MVRISRATQASIAPLPIRIVTNRVARVLNIPGPMNSVEIPGDRIIELEIPNAYMYGIRIVSNDIEYRLSEIRDIRALRNVDAILIFDGFLYGQQGIPGYGYGQGILPGYTYRPQFVRGGELVESGKSFIYPGQVAPPFPLYGPLPPSPCTTPSVCPYNPYPYGWDRQ